MSSKSIEIYNIISQKVIDFAEVIVILFEHCNLRCPMCPQNHDSIENISKEQIFSKINPVVDWINNNDNARYFKIHIMGGEVFEDFFVERDYLSIYQEFIDRISNQISDPTKEVHPNFVTNLVFSHTDKVLEFLEKNDLKISISYDSVGRFSQKDFEIFKRNVEIFKDRISMVSCTMTTTCIKEIIKGDAYFDYLYSNFVIDWDSYWPSTTDSANKLLMPSESELFEFYKLLVDKYPNCLNVEHFVTKNHSMKMTCTRGNSMTILQDNKIPLGCSGAAYLKDGKTANLASGQILENFFEKYNCFSCEFFSRCPFTCFIKADYKHIKHDLDDCLFKKTFQYVESKHQRDH